MNKQRPVNLDLTKFHFPVTSISSILHRITGVLLFLSIPLVLWLLALSLGSADGFAQAQGHMTSLLGKIVTWLILSMIFYHLIAGVRHLFMDAGMGESLQGGRSGSYAVMILSAIVAIAVGVWLW